MAQPAVPAWNPFRVLNIEPSLERHCIGQTKKGERCCMRIAVDNEASAKERLRSHQLDIRAPLRNQRLLKDVASQLLCVRWHQDQAQSISTKWREIIDEYMRGNERRAAAMVPVVPVPIPAPARIPRAVVKAPLPMPVEVLNAPQHAPPPPPPAPARRARVASPVDLAHALQGLDFGLEAPRAQTKASQRPQTNTAAGSVQENHGQPADSTKKAEARPGATELPPPFSMTRPGLLRTPPGRTVDKKRDSRHIRERPELPMHTFLFDFPVHRASPSPSATPNQQDKSRIEIDKAGNRARAFTPKAPSTSRFAVNPSEVVELVKGSKSVGRTKQDEAYQMVQPAKPTLSGAHGEEDELEECPVCYEDILPSSGGKETKAVQCPWCRKSLHWDCFQAVRKGQEKKDRPLTCIMCTNELGLWIV